MNGHKVSPGSKSINLRMHLKSAFCVRVSSVHWLTLSHSALIPLPVPAIDSFSAAFALLSRLFGPTLSLLYRYLLAPSRLSHSCLGFTFI